MERLDWHWSHWLGVGAIGWGMVTRGDGRAGRDDDGRELHKAKESEQESERAREGESGRGREGGREREGARRSER